MSSQQQNNATLVAQPLTEQTKIVWITPEMFLKKRSWAQMIADEEEEEEQDRLREQQEKYKNIMAERKFLLSIGEYQLEEGEILE